MKKFIKTIKKKAQSKGSYDPQEAADTGGASGGTETGYVVREKDLPKLHKAAWTGDLSKVVQLVKKDTSSLDKENRTALHLACAKGHADIVKVLLEWHAKSNIGDSESKTPLLKAVECGHDDCVKLLIEHNAQVDTVDREGNSGLHLAVLYNHPKIVKILTDKGANVNIKNKTEEGLAPLHMSIQFKRDEITRALLIAKANPDVQDNLGRTPLMLACYEGSITPVRMLLQFNANTVIKDKKGFTAEDMANMTGQYAAAQLLSDHAMKLRRSAGGSLAGSVTPRETPRGSVGPSSASTTPRDPSLSHFLPADNNDKVEDSDEENTQSRVSHSQQDDSWADDSVSLGLDKKKRVMQNIPDRDDDSDFGADELGEADEDVPKISLAAKLTKFPDSEGEDEDVDEEDYEEDQEVPPTNIPGRQQQSSVKSNQSHTSIEDNIPYDEEEEEENREEMEEPGRKRTITANRVSFRDESEIREITDDNDTTDIEEDEESGSGAKKPKLDDQQTSSSGYLPTGVSNLSPSAGFDKEKQRGILSKQSADENQGKAFLADLGIDDDVDSGPEISELSDEEPALPMSPPPKITEVDPDNQESEWDSTQPSITPRPGILKNWKQASQDEVEKNTQKKIITPRSDGSEWDSDLENEVDPDQTTSQWDSTAEDGITPRVQNMTYFTEMKSKQEESKVTEEVEEEDEDNQPSEENDVQKMEQPVPDMKEKIMEPVRVVDNQTAAVPKKQETPLSEDEDEDSDWDSEDDMLPSESAPPVYGVPPLPETKESSQKGEHSVSEDIEEESISEWEIERKQDKDKLQKQRAKEEELQRKWEEEQRQAMEEQDRLDEEEQRQALEEEHRLEQIQREAELSRQQKWEEEERLTQERLRREAEEEQMRERELEEEFIAEDPLEETQPLSPKSQSSLDSSSGSQKRGVKSPDTPPTVRLNIKPFQSESSKPPEKEVEEEFIALESKEDLQAPPIERGFTSVKTQAVKEEVKQVKTGSPPLIDLEPELEYVEASARNDDQNVEKSPISIEKTQVPLKEDLIEVTTSFNTASPRRPPQTSVTEQLHNGYDKDTDIHGGQKNRSDGPAFSHNHSLGVNSFNSSPAVNHKRHTPHITAGTSPPNMHSDGMSVDDEDSVDFDFDRPADNMGTYLRGLPGGNYGPYRGIDLPDDDAFSYTSTENGDSMIYQTNSPYGKDVLANMNLSDPATVLKLQEHMHEQNKRLDQEKNTRMTLDNKIRSLNKERNELLKKIDNLSQMRSSLEQTKLDMEQKIRNLEYNLSEEAEMRKNAETLLTKTKEQLARKEEQFTNELEEKQKTELQMRNLQLDLRTTKNNIKQLEDEKSDLQRQLQNERNARQLQEQFNEDQQKIQQALHSEQIKSEAEKDILPFDDDDEDSEAENKLEAVDEDRKSANELLRKLRAENNAFKLEIEKQRLRHRDEVTMLSTETEELQSKIEELKNEIKLNEEALSHATIQYNLQTSNLRTEISVINSVLEKERATKDKLEAELASLKTRYHTISLELDKAEQARNEAERRLQHEKEEWSRQLDTREKEVASLKDNIQGLLHRITNLENKLNLTENELHKTEATLLEKNNMLNKAQKDLDFIQSAHTASEEKCHTEMELHNKLQAKLEQLQEKHTTMQHENLSLKQQVENLQRSIAEQGGDKSLEYTKIIASMQADAEKTKMHWEERNLILSDQCSRLKEENRNIEARRNQLEQENGRLNNEVADQIRKLSVVEANYQNLDQTKRGMEEEKMRLHMEIEKYREKANHEREKSIEAQSKYNTVEDQLRRIQEREETNSQKLLNSSANMEAVNKSKSELEESYQNLKLENAKLEAEVKHERQRVEMLQKDLNDSQKVRNSLEALCSNLKTTNSHLEDKLGHATFTDLGSDEENTTKSLIAQEAEEHKDLWEKEVISRSKLGLKISQYEKQKQDAFVQLEEERRKHRKTIEAKRTAEMKLEAEIDKNTQLQKEVASLKTYLKVAKKRLKGLDSRDSRINSLSADFDRERLTMESTLSSVRQQLQDLQLHLEREIDEKQRLQSKNLKLQNELAELQQLKKVIKKLELSKDKLESEYKAYKNKVETGYVEKEDLERIQREMEARYRMELNRKLEDVNHYLEDQARAREKLDMSRDETEFKIRDDQKKIQEENASLRMKYEQAVAERESREMEVKRYRELYESEMQWRMRLSNQLMQTSDKAFTYKSNLEKQRNRALNTLGNLTFSGTLNGQLLDTSRISGTTDDLFTSKLKAELDRSINKHLEAAPHDNGKPVIRLHSDTMNSSFAKSNADYLEVLQRKYLV